MSDIPDVTARVARAAPVLGDLALQGGGSHGAFTWGVLDRLLEEPGLQIEGISGTSAGAMNAAVLVSGYAHDEAEGARQALERFWRRIADTARFSPLRRGPLDMMLGRWTLDDSPVFLALDMLARVISPYDMNPAGINPLRSILVDRVDWDALRGSHIKLFVTATQVHSGCGRVFRNADSYSSKLNAEWAFVLMLRDEGRRAAAAFLSEHGACLGQQSSFNFDDLLDGVVQ